MSVSYIRKLATQIAQNGVGDPEWHKPLTDDEYQAQMKYRNSDLSIDRVSFSDKTSSEQSGDDEASKV